MAPTPSIKVIKSLPFKGGSRLWSNRYHFSGGTPADSTHWENLVDAFLDDELACIASVQEVVEVIGYAAGSDVPVYTHSGLTAPGTLAPDTGNAEQAGEVAALVRYSTDARTAKNHPIYCFNYYHGTYAHTGEGDGDLLSAAQKSALEAYAAAWVAGYSDGTHTLVRASPNGAVCRDPIVEEYLTHRDFPYTRSA
jgi:hypothetical protein